MEISNSSGKFEDITTDALIVGKFEDSGPESASKATEIFQIGEFLQTLSFTGKYKQSAMVPSKGKVSLVVLVGFGKKEEFTYDKLRNSFAKAIKAVNDMKKKSVTIVAPETLDVAREQKELAFVSKICLYDFDLFRNRKMEVIIESIGIHSTNPSQEAVNEGKVLGEAMNLTRNLANMPASSGTPSHFVEVVKGMKNVKITVFDREEIKQMGMGGIEAVSRGAHEPPKLIVMEYRNGGDSKPLMFVGKGITFDSGGISLKPAENLSNLKFDKSGASAVVGAIKAISELGLKVNVVGLTPLTENVPGGGAYKPGDIIRHYNGVTSEVISTDAEGRLVLADAMSYGVEKYDPAAVIDIATLTGAKVVALGNNVGAIFSNDSNLEKLVMDSAENSWERVWPLPLFDEFKEQIKSEVADIINSGGRPAGAETAAAFLSYFNGNKPWVHLDVQGRTVPSSGPSNRDYLTKGASAFGARLLYEVAEAFQKKSL